MGWKIANFPNRERQQFAGAIRRTFGTRSGVQNAVLEVIKEGVPEGSRIGGVPYIVLWGHAGHEPVRIRVYADNPVLFNEARSLQPGDVFSAMCGSMSRLGWHDLVSFVPNVPEEPMAAEVSTATDPSGKIEVPAELLDSAGSLATQTQAGPAQV